MAKHITPGLNGWTHNAPRLIRGINKKERDKAAADKVDVNKIRREHAEQDFYSDNHCTPRPSGYFGTETDAHFYAR